MDTKTLKTRIKHKSNTSEYWAGQTFSPLEGELVIYNDDNNKQIKIGDGNTDINSLPFLYENKLEIELDGEANGEAALINAHTLDGKLASEYALKFWVLDIAHPVGSYYWSKDPTDPSILFGGTWEQIKDKFILAAGESYAVDETGGEASVTLTTGQLPAHNHVITTYANGASFDIDRVSSGTGTGGTGLETGSANTNKTCGGEAHNNMPPYLVAYCLCRTA